jgi:hypothetical protein
MFFRRVSTPIEKEYQKHMSASQELTGKETSDYLCYGCPPTLAEQRSDQVSAYSKTRENITLDYNINNVNYASKAQTVYSICPPFGPLTKSLSIMARI